MKDMEGIHPSLGNPGQPANPTSELDELSRGLGGAMPQTSPDPTAKPAKFSPGDETPWPGATTGRGLSESAAADARIHEASLNGGRRGGKQESIGAGAPTSMMSLEDLVGIFAPMPSRARKEFEHLKDDRRLLALSAQSIANLGPEGMRGAIRSLLDNARMSPLEKLAVLVDVVAGLSPFPLMSLDNDAMQPQPTRDLPPGMKEQSLGEYLVHTLDADALPRRKYRQMLEEIDRLRLSLRFERERSAVAGAALLKAR